LGKLTVLHEMSICTRIRVMLVIWQLNAWNSLPNGVTMDLSNLESFGSIAAEDDAVRDYFLTTDAVVRILQGKTLLVLGRKGSGKTALVKHFTGIDQKMHGSPLSLRNYPWNAHAQLVDKGVSDTEAYVASWRLLIAIRIASLVCKLSENVYLDSAEALKKFLIANYNNIDPEPRSILAQQKLSVVGLTFGPQIAGISLGSISFGDDRNSKFLGLELDSLANSILRDASIAISELGIEKLFLHFDELDQGLDKVDETKARILIGLILAARQISTSDDLRANISPIVYLRTDIWEQLFFSDKNKITQTAAYVLTWNEETLLRLVNERIKAKLGSEKKWDAVIDEQKMRGSQPKWQHIVSRTFLRPRDVISFLNEALTRAKQRSDRPLVFINEDINSARDGYSSYLKAELDDEITPHWLYWEDALQACSSVSTVTFEPAQFKSAYEQHKRPENKLSADQALDLLFRFSVIGYERRLGKGGVSWEFKYSNPTVRWDPSAAKLKVHAGLKEYARLKEERR
jgi:energy-coupling factor transporter ATP-binding protein EcfA2